MSTVLNARSCSVVELVHESVYLALSPVHWFM